MIIYRLGRSRHISDLTGEGARINGGRWNHRGIPCIYASESRALALLEYTVNINIDDIPRSLSIAAIEIPDSRIQTLTVAKLPGNWQASPAPAETRDFGSDLLLAAKYPVIKIPSCVIHAEFNFLLNPLHPESAQFKISSIQDFIYDIRLKTV